MWRKNDDGEITRRDMDEANMGLQPSKSSSKLERIDRDVNYFRSSIRGSNRKLTKEAKDQMFTALAYCSNEAHSLKGKVKPAKLEQVQSTISKTMEEIVSCDSQDANLDMGAVETNSIVQVPVSKRQMSNSNIPERPNKKQKNVPTLQEVEDKFRSLEPEVKIAMRQKDSTQLRVFLKTMKVLVTDLQMMTGIKEHTPLGDRKNILEDSIVSLHNEASRLMKEIKRDRNINYLTDQNQRVLNQLKEIETGLVEIESALQSVVQTRDENAMNGLRENVLLLKQQLSSIESINETTKQVQKQLLQKIKSITQVIDDNTKGSSHSDLTKAQVNYEDIIKNIASGNRVDKDEIKIKLESLQDFIRSIKEDNEVVVRGKQQLLNNVRESFSFILNEEQKIQNAVEESTNKPGNSCLQELDSFCSKWKSIKNTINKSSLEDLSKIDDVLSTIQKSIEEERNKIAKSKSLPSNLIKKMNRSTPNLSSSRSSPSKYGSSHSIDVADQSMAPVKTTVKVYNLSTPQIQNINDQPVVLRNKNFYQNTANPENSRPFSKLEEIKTQVNYIKEKFKDSQQKQHLKNKLESYIEIINSYIHHQNQKIADNAKALLLEIQDMLRSLSHIPEAMNSTSQRRVSIELSFENVVGIQRAVEEIEKAIATFEGKKDDPEYKRIKEDLAKCQRYLESIEIPPKYDMVRQQREEVLSRFEGLYHALENKCYNYYEDVEMGNTKQKLNALKEKVNRFSGAHRGVLYNQIDKDLKKLLVDVTERVSDKTVAEEITNDVEKHLKILEQRATKDQSFRRPSNQGKTGNEDEEKLMKLKNDLLNIKTTIDTTPTNAENLFMGLKGRLDLVKLGLDQLKFTSEDEEKQRDILYNEVETLKNMVEAKISLARQAVRQWPIEQDKEKVNLEELRKIEEKFQTLKPQIESFTGLLKEIYNYGDLLDQRAKQSEDLLEIERGVNDIERNFARNLKLNDLDALNEKVVALKTRITNAQYNEHLLQRKQTCIRNIEALLEKISSNKERSTTDNVPKQIAAINPSHSISTIELQFARVKKEIDAFPGTSTESKFVELNNTLKSLLLTLDNIKLAQGDELRSRTIVLSKEVHAYIDILHSKAQETETIKEVENQLRSINDMIDTYKGMDTELNVIEQELRTAKETPNVQQAMQGATGARLAEIQNEIYFVRGKVSSFINSDTSEEYKTIEDTLLRLRLRLGKLQTQGNQQFIKKQHELEKEIKNCLSILDERSLEAASVIEIEEELERINDKLRNAIDDKERSALDEKLISLQTKLAKLRINKDLLLRKNVCLSRIAEYLKQLRSSGGATSQWYSPRLL
ncbi:hypothetical protein NQ315_001710 [Exocentrus adspersus]|uniref:Uncharacterized protein n=1 Tax=Exocentrus adspersus TaxID=1586481 RepID=A0AAV8WBV0_9CUCU|nr:hypothetical protein NQ315_001710 [Exocentrus adspersus]